MSQDKSQFVANIPAIAEMMTGANVIDIKTIDTDVPMRTFIARLLSYQPGWITSLYRVRQGFVRLLGMRQEGVPQPTAITPEEVPMTPGDAAYFFTVTAAEEDRYWMAGLEDSHLSANLGVAVEPLDGQRRRYYVITLVHYNNWQGPVYFNVIRQFHHLVVRAMMRHAARPEPASPANAAV